MSSFFLPSKGSRQGTKRKSGPAKAKGAKKSQLPRSNARKVSALSEEIPSDSDVESPTKKPHRAREEEEGDEAEREETAAEKRLRLAKEYLARLEESGTKDDGGDHDVIGERLKEDLLEQTGRLQKRIAHLYTAPDPSAVRFFKSHQLPLTCVAMTMDEKYVYSGSKDCTVTKWDIESGKKQVVFVGHHKGVPGGVAGHTGQVLAVAVSSDGKFVATGGQDKVIHIWDGETNLHLHTFRGHNQPISGLVFQKGTHELFSCSFDRTVKIWNLNEMVYVETLFGHQDPVGAIDCLNKERPVTAGTSDRTLRVWKILEESHLVFNGHKSSIDCVKMINDDHFVSGSQDGTIAIWNVVKKKPLVTVKHKIQEDQPSSGSGDSPNWVTAVAALPNTDLIASGASDGYIRLWRCGDGFRSLEPCFSIPMPGVINGLAFSHSGKHLVAAVAQEHRFGRWWKVKGVKNGVAVVSLSKQSVEPMTSI